jgi:hypothetical protein
MGFRKAQELLLGEARRRIGYVFRHPSRLARHWTSGCTPFSSGLSIFLPTSFAQTKRWLEAAW